MTAIVVKPIQDIGGAELPVVEQIPGIFIIDISADGEAGNMFCTTPTSNTCERSGNTGPNGPGTEGACTVVQFGLGIEGGQVASRAVLVGAAITCTGGVKLLA